MPRRRRTDDEAEWVYDAVGREIRRARGGRTQTWLGDAIGADQGTISDYEVGRTRVPLHVIMQIEQALGLGKGELLAKAEVVDPEQVPIETTTVAAIRQDPDLMDDQKRVMVDLYQTYMRYRTPASVHDMTDRLPADETPAPGAPPAPEDWPELTVFRSDVEFGIAEEVRIVLDWPEEAGGLPLRTKDKKLRVLRRFRSQAREQARTEVAEEGHGA